jgi:hypothetical protein
MKALTTTGMTPLEQKTWVVDNVLNTLTTDMDLTAERAYFLYTQLLTAADDINEYNSMMDDMTSIEEVLRSGMHLTQDELAALLNYYRLLKKVLDGDIVSMDELTNATTSATAVLEKTTIALNAQTEAIQRDSDAIDELNDKIATYQQLQADIKSQQESGQESIRSWQMYNMSTQEKYNYSRGEFIGTMTALQGDGMTPEERIALWQKAYVQLQEVTQANIDWANEYFDTLRDKELELYNARMDAYNTELEAIQANIDAAEQELELAKDTLETRRQEKAEFGTNLTDIIQDMRLSAMTPIDRFNTLRNQILMTSMSGLGALGPEERLEEIQKVLANWQELQQLAVSIYGEGAGEAIAATEEVITNIEKLRTEGTDAYDKLIALSEIQIADLNMQIGILKGEEESVLKDIYDETTRHNLEVERIEEERTAAIAAIVQTAINILGTLDIIGDGLSTLAGSEITRLQNEIETLKGPWYTEDAEGNITWHRPPPEGWTEGDELPTQYPFGEYPVGGVVPRSGVYSMEQGEVVLPVTGANPTGVNMGSGEVTVVVLPMYYKHVDKATIEKYVREDVIPALEKESKVRGKPFLYDRAIKKTYKVA